jgi:hypothetical protein
MKKIWNFIVLLAEQRKKHIQNNPHLTARY